MTRVMLRTQIRYFPGFVPTPGNPDFPQMTRVFSCSRVRADGFESRPPR